MGTSSRRFRESRYLHAEHPVESLGRPPALDGLPGHPRGRLCPRAATESQHWASKRPSRTTNRSPSDLIRRKGDRSPRTGSDGGPLRYQLWVGSPRMPRDPDRLEQGAWHGEFLSAEVSTGDRVVLHRGKRLCWMEGRWEPRAHILPRSFHRSYIPRLDVVIPF